MERILYQFLHLRITTDNNKEWVETIIRAISHKWIISMENNGKQHYHSAFYTNLSTKQIKEKLNDFGLSGNKSFSLTMVKDNKAVRKYIVKDGDFWYHGFQQQEITDAYQLSFKKNGFKISLEELEDEYLLSNMSHELFGYKYIQLKATHNFSLNRSQIKAYLDKMRCRKEPGYAERIYEELYRFG